MAGIGWRLEHLIDQRSLAGPAAAYATGAAVMALPWVLTSLVLVALPAVVGRDSADFATARMVVDVAYAVALLVDGPLQVVISRFVADRIYEGRLAAIAAPFRRGLSMAFLMSALTSSMALLALGLPPATAIWGGALSASVSAQWTVVSVGNGLCSPGLVLGAVAAGAAQSFLLSALLVAAAGLGIPGYLFGLVSGQCLTFAIVVAGVLRALPDQSDESARLWPAFHDYAALAGAGLAFNASLWVDKIVVSFMAGGETAELHGAASTLAWFSTIPCLAWIFVEVETTFHRRFRAFYADLEGGASLNELRRGAATLSKETGRLLCGAGVVQAAVILWLQLAAGRWIRWLGLPDATPFRLLLVAAGLQALALLGLIILYHFDLRHEALLAATSLFVGVAVSTTVASAAGLPPGAGTLLGCAVGAILTWRLVGGGVRAVLRNTLLDQPFGGEGMPLTGRRRPEQV